MRPAKSSAPEKEALSRYFLFSLRIARRLFADRDARAAVAKFSGLEPMVVPGGVFHEVTGDISVRPEDDALVREMEYFAAVLT